MSDSEHSISSPGAFLDRLIVTSTLSGVIVALFALSVVLYIMPMLLLCTGSERYFAYSSVLTAEGPNQGDNQMNRVAVVQTSVWVMVIMRTLFDWFLVEHNFKNEPIVSALFGAVCAGIAICLIGCVKRAAYGIAVLVALLLITLYIEERTTRGIVMAFLILAGIGIIALTKGWIESVVMTGVIGFLCSWSLVYCVLYFMSSVKTRLDDVTRDVTTEAQTETDAYRRTVHLLSISALFLLNATLCMAWGCVKRCKHRIFAEQHPNLSQAELVKALQAVAGRSPPAPDPITAPQAPVLPASAPTTPRGALPVGGMIGNSEDFDSSDDDDQPQSVVFDLNLLTPQQRNTLALQLAVQR